MKVFSFEDGASTLKAIIAVLWLAGCLGGHTAAAAPESLRFTLKCKYDHAILIFRSDGSQTKEEKGNFSTMFSFEITTNSGRVFDFETGKWTMLTSVTPTELGFERDVDPVNHLRMVIDRRNGHFTRQDDLHNGIAIISAIDEGNCDKVEWQAPAKPSTRF